MKKGKYNEEEKALILQVGDNYPHNLREGFKELSTLLDRSIACISSEYYYLKKKEQKKGNNSFILFSKNKVIEDRKIVRKGCPMKPISPTKGFWDRIKKLFK